MGPIAAEHRYPCQTPVECLIKNTAVWLQQLGMGFGVLDKNGPFDRKQVSTHQRRMVSSLILDPWGCSNGNNLLLSSPTSSATASAALNNPQQASTTPNNPQQALTNFSNNPSSLQVMFCFPAILSRFSPL